MNEGEKIHWLAEHLGFDLDTENDKEINLILRQHVRSYSLTRALTEANKYFKFTT